MPVSLIPEPIPAVSKITRDELTDKEYEKEEKMTEEEEEKTDSEEEEEEDKKTGGEEERSEEEACEEGASEEGASDEEASEERARDEVAIVKDVEEEIDYAEEPKALDSQKDKNKDGRNQTTVNEDIADDKAPDANKDALDDDLEIEVEDIDRYKKFADKYNTKELREMCRNKGLNTQGKKVDMAERILNHTGGGDEIIICS